MAIYKRGKTWWMGFNFNGKHVQKSTKSKSKRDAETIERAFITQLAKGEVGIETKPDAPTFQSAIMNFLTWVAVEHQNKPNTVRSYNATSKALIEFFGESSIDEIESGDIEKFKQWRSKQKCKPRSETKSKKAVKTNGKKNTKLKPTTLRPATINRELALLKIF